MSDPVMVVIAGPNGAGKSTFFTKVIGPITTLPFVNADEIATAEWPGDELAHGLDASRYAAEERARRLAARSSFATETVFSHESKLALVQRALRAGYIVDLHVLWVAEDVSVARVAQRVNSQTGTGHDVPEDRVRARHRRLWPIVAAAVREATTAAVYDNSHSTGPVVIGRFRTGELVGPVRMPAVARRDLAPIFGQAM